MTKNSSAVYIQSVGRAISVLRSFTETEPELGVVELGSRLGLHKSTVFRMLATLEQEGLVSQNPATGKYRLGLGLISLAGVALGRLDVRALSQPLIGDLVEKSGETVNVTILDGGECVNIERGASPKSIRYVGWIGRRTPLHCTASGKVILAYMNPEERALHLSKPLTRYTEFTPVHTSELEPELARICQQGYAIVHEEFEEGFSAIAAGVFNHRAELAGTISISGPTFRISPAKLKR